MSINLFHWKINSKYCHALELWEERLLYCDSCFATYEKQRVQNHCENNDFQILPGYCKKDAHRHGRLDALASSYDRRRSRVIGLFRPRSSDICKRFADLVLSPRSPFGVLLHYPRVWRNRMNIGVGAWMSSSYDRRRNCVINRVIPIAVTSSHLFSSRKLK